MGDSWWGGLTFNQGLRKYNTYLLTGKKVALFHRDELKVFYLRARVYQSEKCTFYQLVHDHSQSGPGSRVRDLLATFTLNVFSYC